MRDRAPLPSWADWQDRAESLGLRNRSGELVGPCPACGGVDRFHVRRRGPDALVGCRGCIDGGGRGFGAVLRVAFPEHSGRGGANRPVTRPESRPEPREAPVPVNAGPETAAPLTPRERAVRAIWAATVPADSTMGRRYLTRREVWPPAGIGPDLPSRTCRWLAADAAPPANRAAKWYGMPDPAAGCLVFAWRLPSTPKAWPGALSLLAVDADGERLRWSMGSGAGPKVRTLGPRAGLAFCARPGDGGRVHLAEGEPDALALSIAPWTDPGAVYAAGGTGGMKRLAAELDGPITVHLDGDAAGTRSAAGTVETYGPGEDPASTLGGDVGERAAMLEFEAGMEHAEATAAAWRAVLGIEEAGGRVGGPAPSSRLDPGPDPNT